jgi:hypothetical protein
MTVYGSSEWGRAYISTYRGRPPDREELEEVRAFNMTEEPEPRMLSWADTAVDVGDTSVRGRVAFVPASRRFITDRWALLLFGGDYSASISLDGMTPDDLVLTMQNSDTGYSDLRTAISHHPGSGERPPGGEPNHP